MNPKALLENETVVYEGRLHWKLFIVPVFLCILVWACVGAVLFIGRPPHEKGGAIAVSVGLLLSLVILLPALMKYLTTWIVVTNQRVIARAGLMSRQSFDMLLVKIEGISVEQGVMGRLINYGTIIVRGIGGGKENFESFSAPAEISRQVHQQIVNFSKSTR